MKVIRLTLFLTALFTGSFVANANQPLFESTDDLTITSAQTAEVGDDITVVGTVVLDTDFGFGYKYPLLVEKSKITKN